MFIFPRDYKGNKERFTLFFFAYRHFVAHSFESLNKLCC